MLLRRPAVLLPALAIAAVLLLGAPALAVAGVNATTAVAVAVGLGPAPGPAGAGRTLEPVPPRRRRQTGGRFTKCSTGVLGFDSSDIGRRAQPVLNSLLSAGVPKFVDCEALGFAGHPYFDSKAVRLHCPV